MIDLQRIDKLISGEVVAETYAEEVFVVAYTCSSGGDTLMTLMLNLKGSLDALKLHEMHMILLGYAMGQHEVEELEANLANMNELNKDKKPFH